MSIYYGIDSLALVHNELDFHLPDINVDAYGEQNICQEAP